MLTREVAGAEGIEGGFSAVYDVLKAMEDAGRIRRGYFVGGVGAMQFALPAALELMRSFKDLPEDPETVVLAATDPANPYGTMLKWPALTATESATGRGPTRTVGSIVVLVNGFAGSIHRARRTATPSCTSRRTNPRVPSSAGRLPDSSPRWPVEKRAEAVYSSPTSMQRPRRTTHSHRF